MENMKTLRRKMGNLWMIVQIKINVFMYINILCRFDGEYFAFGPNALGSTQNKFCCTDLWTRFPSSVAVDYGL